MKDVALASGVSVMTVSRAFKDDASVGDDTRKRIQAKAEELGYVFDSMAANLRSQRSHFVAVTIPSINNANFAEMVEAMTKLLRDAGFQVLLGHTNYDVNREELLIEEFLRRRPEAIIVTGGRHTERGRRLLANAGVPVIETWDLPESPIDHVVGFSNAAAIDMLVAFLVNKGMTRIAFLGGDTDGDTRGADRRRGFIAAMKARNLESTRLVGGGQPPISMREGALAMGRLLEDLPDTEAVICVSDLAAFGALSECQRRGVKVPEQIAIAGFGAYDIAGISVPTITTINPFPAEIGRRAAEIVIAKTEDQQAKITWVITPVLNEGQSTERA
ncbi:MAG: LacI family DNA-binding transcriptional regulator [Cypionkella sp.]